MQLRTEQLAHAVRKLAELMDQTARRRSLRWLGLPGHLFFAHGIVHGPPPCW
jgi:hypothetical protein